MHVQFVLFSFLMFLSTNPKHDMCATIVQWQKMRLVQGSAWYTLKIITAVGIYCLNGENCTVYDFEHALSRVIFDLVKRCVFRVP